MRRATQADLAAVQDFLAPRVATSMFLSGNLRDQGLTSAQTAPRAGADHRKSMTLWLGEEAGQITGVIGYAAAGYVVFEAPALTQADYPALREALFGRPLLGLNGAVDQVAHLVAALDLPCHRAAMDEVEPHYHLALSALTIPSGAGRLRPALAQDLPQLIQWRMASEVETLGARDSAENRARARVSLQELMAADRLRVLEQDGLAVAMTNFNAALPAIVQVGGVYTPPDLRGRGYARRAVALHLAEARGRGVTEAILFAANTAAARAYEAIGFARIGSYRIVNFDPGITLGETQLGELS
ncbi:GNAT family N-acetyltransferase [Pseudophaeobacter arcticus]|uniref:GNAT family N-acetyltransferase n=1 Tax=Pseudophaeobacter arcticus TaxID=385492 RepID=UPI00040ED25A|nr:GNAT family N-acetyltransferase [Pseudophaeobacter arcticus]